MCRYPPQGSKKYGNKKSGNKKYTRETRKMILMSEMAMRPDSQGKVRDLYDLGDKLLIVATDRISAFDYILKDEIPHKGEVLTRLSLFWFDLLADIIPNHLISADVADLPEKFKPYAEWLNGRFMLVRKAEMFPVECIVRVVVVIGDDATVHIDAEATGEIVEAARVFGGHDIGPFQEGHQTG